MAAVIELREVTYTYPLAGRPAIRGLSLSLEAGRVYGVVGENGGGKTSLCALIRGFAPACHRGELKGEVLIDGRPTAAYGPGELALRIGYVFQNPLTQISGVKDTVFEELAFGLENFGVPPGEIEGRVLRVMETTGIAALAEKNPFDLSGGQQQRMALASVIVLEPEILVMDEPTSRLDPEGAEGVFAIIKMMKEEKKTIVLAEHKVEQLAEFADAVLVLHEGALVRMGPPAEVLADTGLAEIGVRLPQAALLAGELIRRGLPLNRIPVTGDDLAAALGKR
jgi:energy-coupling factor transport system ATP-binding protein